MQRIAFGLSILSTLAIIGMGTIDSLNGNNGIVALEGFPEGVVLCGEGTFINQGYEDDPRVQQLLDLAENTCPQ